MQLTPDTGVVAYGAVAERDGSEYSALMSSTYVRRDDGWKLAFTSRRRANSPPSWRSSHAVGRRR
jgi:hypothetical protein